MAGVHSRLEKLVEANPSYSGTGRLTKKARQRITIACRCAIKMWTGQITSMGKQKAAQNLTKDLTNIPYHVFGHHTRCSTTFCKAVSDEKAPILEDEREVDDETEVDPITETARLWHELTDDQVLEESRLDLLDGPIFIGNIGTMEVILPLLFIHLYHLLIVYYLHVFPCINRIQCNN